MQTLYKTDNGKLIHGDNIEVMTKLKDNSVDSCISDFPYNLAFMGKTWDKTIHFYNWCKARAEPLFRIIKPGGYVLVFGYPKTNHRMKCAFEDAGFNIVEEIDWVYGTGFPKNQDIGKLFDKKGTNPSGWIEFSKIYNKIIERSNYNHNDIDRYLGIKASSCYWARTDHRGGLPPKHHWEGIKLLLNLGNEFDSLYEEAEREVIEKKNRKPVNDGSSNIYGTFGKNADITIPSTDKAKQWNGWKTAGLKPAHETITVFQKPLEGTYINNIDIYNVGGMNIDACRIETSQEDKDMMDAKSSKNPTTNYSNKDDKIYGKYAEDKASPANEIGRFPANMIFDSPMGEELDSQSGVSASKKSMRGVGLTDSLVYGNADMNFDTMRGHNDSGGASRFFLNIDTDDFVPFHYCAKATKKEKGEGNTHVTVKPKALIKWLIKLVTPVNGRTIDITAGSGTHGLSCEELNKDEGYNLQWLNIEMLNTEKDPYCEIAMNRIKEVVNT